MILYYVYLYISFYYYILLYILLFFYYTYFLFIAVTSLQRSIWASFATWHFNLSLINLNNGKKIKKKKTLGEVQNAEFRNTLYVCQF